MFIVQATHWISGVFSELPKAEQYLQSIPEPQRANQRIVQSPVAKYPIFIVEDRRGFEHGDVNFVRARLRKLEPCGENHVHLTVYAILEDFEPSVPGVDNMSKIRHWHIEDWYLVPRRLRAFVQELEKMTPDV